MDKDEILIRHAQLVTNYKYIKLASDQYYKHLKRAIEKKNSEKLLKKYYKNPDKYRIGSAYKIHKKKNNAWKIMILKTIQLIILIPTIFTILILMTKIDDPILIIYLFPLSIMLINVLSS